MKRKIWKPEELKYLQKVYSYTSNKLLAERFGASLQSICGQAGNLKLKKAPEFLLLQNQKLGKALANSPEAISSRYKKGHIPANLGKKMTIEMRKKVQHTFFPKGHLPKNTLHDGDITTRISTKKNTKYKYIRLAKGKWQMLQIYNWIKKNGPIPGDKIIVCKDGNTLNCNPDNWMLLNRTQHLERNSGRCDLTDKYIKHILAPRNKEMQEQIAQSPGLIKLKRTELKLRRTINEHN